MAVDLDRLQAQLLVSKLQTSNQPLYQVISQLIKNAKDLENLVSSIASGGGGGGGTTINQIVQQFLDVGGGDGGGGGDSDSVIPGPMGPQGPTGVSTSAFFYRCDAVFTGISDPGAGKYRYDNATQNLATTLIFDNITVDGFDTVLLFLLMGAPQHIIIQEEDFSINHQIWQLTGSATVLADFFTVPVSFVSSGGAGVFANNQRVAILIPSEGSTGPAGPEGPMGAIIFPPDAEDGDVFPPIMGPQGNPGVAGIQGDQGPAGVLWPLEDGADGEDGAPGPPGVDGQASVWNTIIKTVTDDRASNTTFTADSELQFAVAANSVYVFKAIIQVRVSLDDMKFRFNCGVAVNRFTALVQYFTGAATTVTTSSVGLATQPTAQFTIVLGATFHGQISIEGTVTTASNAGTFTIEFAQIASGATDCQFAIGSILEWVKTG